MEWAFECSAGRGGLASRRLNSGAASGEARCPPQVDGVSLEWGVVALGHSASANVPRSQDRRWDRVVEWPINGVSRVLTGIEVISEDRVVFVAPANPRRVSVRHPRVVDLMSGDLVGRAWMLLEVRGLRLIGTENPVPGDLSSRKSSKPG